MPRGTRGSLTPAGRGKATDSRGEAMKAPENFEPRRLARSGRLGVLYAQSHRKTLTQSVLPRLLARIWSGLSFRRWIIIPRRVRKARPRWQRRCQEPPGKPSPGKAKPSTTAGRRRRVANLRPEGLNNVVHPIARLDQACAHCPKFLTAALTRRALFHSRCGGTFSQTRQG